MLQDFLTCATHNWSFRRSLHKHRVRRTQAELDALDRQCGDCHAPLEIANGMHLAARCMNVCANVNLGSHAEVTMTLVWEEGHAVFRVGRKCPSCHQASIVRVAQLHFVNGAPLKPSIAFDFQFLQEWCALSICVVFKTCIFTLYKPRCMYTGIGSLWRAEVVHPSMQRASASMIGTG